MSEIYIKPTHKGADAFWKYWKENGETGKHGYYESTWGAINAAIKVSGITQTVTDKEALFQEIEKMYSEVHECTDGTTAEMVFKDDVINIIRGVK